MRDKGGAEAVAELLGGFLSYRAERVGTPKELAERMARQAHMIWNLIVATFKKEPEGDSLHTQLVAQTYNVPANNLRLLQHRYSNYPPNPSKTSYK